MRNFLWLACGVALGLLCALGGLGVGGAGHGWTSAWFFGLLSLVLCPLAFYRLGNYKFVSARVNYIFLASAIALDLLLWGMTIFGGVEYFYKMIVPALFWIVLWSVWQFAVMLTIVLSLRETSFSLRRESASHGDATRHVTDIKTVVHQRLANKTETRR